MIIDGFFIVSVNHFIYYGLNIVGEINIHFSLRFLQLVSELVLVCLVNLFFNLVTFHIR